MGAIPHVNRKQYLVIWVVLFALTILEVGVAIIPGIDKGLLVSTLIIMALAKAFIVGWFYMHLGHDTKTMKLTVLIPFFFPALYAFVLIADAAWRLG